MFVTLQMWSGPERLLALDELIDRCETSQVKHMMQVIEPQFQRDFISLLPKEVKSQQIRASLCVSQHQQGPECVCVFVCSWLCTCWASWLLETSCRLLRPAATGGSWLKTTCCGGRSATRKVSPRFLTFPVCSSLNSPQLPQTH